MSKQGSADTPVLVIGVGRSGTQLLSWALEQHPAFYNSYENRYIWSYGQTTSAHDVRAASDITSKVRSFIRGYFCRRSAETGKTIIDKTPSNTFRVAFVHAVFPEAKIIHIIRDGRDNVLSRYHEWYGDRKSSAAHPVHGGTSSLRYRMTLLKSRCHHLREMVQRRNVPLSRSPVFIGDNLWPFLANIVGGKPIRYGERFPGMRDHLRTYGMFATCAVQWREGVVHAAFEGRRLPTQNYLEVRYEDVVRHPKMVWEQISGFLAIDDPSKGAEFLERNVVRDNADKWRLVITEEQMHILERHIRPTLEFFGYRWS